MILCISEFWSLLYQLLWFPISYFHYLAKSLCNQPISESLLILLDSLYLRINSLAYSVSLYWNYIIKVKHSISSSSSHKNKKRRKLRLACLSFFPRLILRCFSAPVWMCCKNSIIQSFVFFVNFLEVRSTKTRRRNLIPSFFLSSFESLYLLNSNHLDQIVAVLLLDV